MNASPNDESLVPLAAGSLSGKTALVTGSSRGIGADTVRYFAQAGANVVINYRNKAPRAEKLAADLRNLGVDVLVVGADLTDAESVQAMFSEVERTFGSLDVLVLNASGGMESGMGEEYARALAGMDERIAAGSENRVTSHVYDLTRREPTDLKSFIRRNIDKWTPR